MNKIILWGYYGKNNFGDDLMLDNICNYLSIKDINRVSVITANKNDTYITNNKDIIIYETYRNNKFKNLKLFLNIFRKNDYFVWGGGTCFSDEDGVPNLIIVLLAKLLRLKVYFIGIGIGNLNKLMNKIKVKLSACLIDKMYLRDAKSYNKAIQYFNSRKLSLTEDIAYMYKFKNEKSKLNVKTIVISLRNLDNYKSVEEQKKFLNNIYLFLETIIKSDNYKQVKILSLDSNSDNYINSIVYNKIIKRFKSCLKVAFIKNKSYKYKMKVLQESDFNIIVRLHGVLVSEIFGVKTIALIYADKVKSFLESIGSKYFVNIDDVISDKDSLIKYYNYIKTHDNNCVNVESYYNKALNNFNFLIDSKGNNYEG